MSQVITSLNHYLIFRIGIEGWCPPGGYMASFRLLDEYAAAYADDEDDDGEYEYDSRDSFSEDAYEIAHSELPQCERDPAP